MENDLYENIVKNHLTETRWHEVFLLISGLLRGKINQLFKADHLLLAMEKEANNYLKTSLGKSKLVPILQWADEMTKDSLDSPIKPVGRRAIANVYAEAIAYAYASPRADGYVRNFTYKSNLSYVNAYANPYVSNFANFYVDMPSFADLYFFRKIFNNPYDKLIELANLFAQDRIFSRVNIPKLIGDLQTLRLPANQAQKRERQEFAKQLFKIWHTAFALTPELLNLSQEELQEIDNHYFYINRLILDCQKVAVNISPTVWQGIEDRMLCIP